MRTVIYSRVSTLTQTTDNQLAQLTAIYPHAEVVQETASGVKARPELKRLVDSLMKGDVLVVAALDRLGRRTVEILGLIEDLDRRGIVLRSLREGVDYSSISGRLVVQILASVAELERSILSERTKAGLAARRAKGIIGGRRPKFDPSVVSEVRRLRKEGQSLRAISKQTGVSPTRIYHLTKSK